MGRTRKRMFASAKEAGLFYRFAIRAWQSSWLVPRSDRTYVPGPAPWYFGFRHNITNRVFEYETAEEFLIGGEFQNCDTDCPVKFGNFASSLVAHNDMYRLARFQSWGLRFLRTGMFPYAECGSLEEIELKAAVLGDDLRVNVPVREWYKLCAEFSNWGFRLCVGVVATAVRDWIALRFRRRR